MFGSGATRRTMRRRGLLVMTVALALVASTVIVDAVARFTPASATGTNKWDASSAMRYDTDGTVIGDIIPDLIDEDDEYWIDTSTPFPTNFFGTKYADLCVTTNGTIYPSNGTCTDDYDQGVGDLAIEGQSPMIAALATDIDPGESSLMIENEDGVMPSGPVTDTSGASGGAGTLTVTTSASVSDLSVGDKVYFWGTGDATLDDADFTITALDTVAKTISFSVGSAVPDNIAQGKWYYYRTYTFGEFTNTSTTGSAVTISSVSISEGDGLMVGDYIAFQSADADLNSKIFEVTAVDTGANTLTFNLPVGGTAPSPTATGYWFFSDGVGAVRTVNYGTTTIDGRQALVFTWYRIAENDADNADFLYNTLQIVVVKRATGDLTAGFDFDIEFNYGTLLDDEDGYHIDDPTDSCTAYDSAGQPDELADCRWGVGTASYVSGLQVQSITFSGTTATLTTVTPHGLAGKGSEVWLELDASGDPVLGALNSNDRASAKVTGPSTLTFTVETPGANTTFGSPPTINASDVYELYGAYAINRLANSGDTAMVKNSLNSSVRGRYTFGMAGGTPTQFKTLAQVVGGGSTGLDPFRPGGSGDPGPGTAPPPAPAPTPTTAPATSTGLPPLQPVVSQTTVTVPAGQSVVLQNGVPVGTTVQPNAGRTGIVMQGPDFLLNVIGQQQGGAPSQLNANGQLEVTSGQGLGVSGTGFAPSTEAQVYVLTGAAQPTATAARSTRAASTAALLLGTTKVNADGSFGAVLPIPSTLAPGNYVAQVVGYSPSLQVRVASLGMVLSDSVVSTKRIKSQVLFAPLSKALTGPAKDRLAAAVKRVPKGAKKVTVQVIGFVQPTMGTSNDQVLSTARANAVAAQLKAAGLKGKYVISGRGQATQSGPQGRRVEVVIAYQMG